MTKFQIMNESLLPWCLHRCYISQSQYMLIKWQINFWLLWHKKKQPNGWKKSLSTVEKIGNTLTSQMGGNFACSIYELQSVFDFTEFGKQMNSTLIQSEFEIIVRGEFQWWFESLRVGWNDSLCCHCTYHKQFYTWVGIGYPAVKILRKW